MAAEQVVLSLDSLLATPELLLDSAASNRQFAELVMRCIGQQSEQEDPLRALFQVSATGTQRDFMVSCILRYLSVAETNVESDRELAIQVYKLLDEVIPESVYRRLGIDKSAQRYVKQKHLPDLARQTEERLGKLMESPTGLSSVAVMRQSLMAELNSDLGKLLLAPWMPDVSLDVQLKEVFDAVGEYQAANETNILGSYEAAMDRLREFSDMAHGWGTTYSTRLLGGVAGTLLELLASDRKRNPLFQPARIEIRASDKKYPLTAAGRDFDIVLKVSNVGKGAAIDLNLSFPEEGTTDNISLEDREVFLGRLRQSVDVQVRAKVERPDELALLTVEAVWQNSDGQPGEFRGELELHAQRADVDWTELSLEEPYSLEPVTSESHLVGRRELLTELLAKAKAPSLGSFFMYGQKRVGKTSVARVFESRLRVDESGKFVPIYVEAGDFVHPDATRTIESLGQILCEETRNADPQLASLEVPEFSGSLTPLARFLRAAHRLAPDLRWVFLIDEFDELPVELYRRGAVGDSFFENIRSISGRKYCGFILVGGEKMDLIINSQGQHLNKFAARRIDYFDQESHRADFVDLVSSPVRGRLEFSDSAISTLHMLTAGHPFFAKLILAEVFRMAVERKDSHAAEQEVRDGVLAAIQSTGPNAFQHFWDDGIIGSDQAAIEEMSDRRSLLVAMGNALRKRKFADRAAIVGEARSLGLSEPDVIDLLDQFERRRVLEKDENGHYHCVVRFFELWLSERGMREILTSFPEQDESHRRQHEEDELYVRSEEISRLVSNWGTYRGRAITEDSVRNWLKQFGELKAQRLMFKILESVRFYSGQRIREKLREAHGIVRRDLVHRIEKGKRKRSDILVTYHDAPGKSGAHYAKLYADENGIYYQNVVEKGELATTLLGRASEISAVVFVDDFVGTGQSAIEYLTGMDREIWPIAVDNQVKSYFFAVCGFTKGADRLRKALRAEHLPLSVHICDPLDESDKCFSEASSVFPDEGSRLEGLREARHFGSRLEKKNPLGWGELQAAVVFEDAIPNASLPILWAEDAEWKALFPRL